MSFTLFSFSQHQQQAARFKKTFRHSRCNHKVRKIVNYFNGKGNTVNIGVIDLKKAFDKANIYGIIDAVLNQGLNPSIAKVILYWLSNQKIRAKVANSLSDKKSLSCGVRQGGILSPILFSLYVDLVLTKLESSNSGCFLGYQCLNSFLYADDLILLSISVDHLQKLFNTCSDVLRELDLPIIMISHDNDNNDKS